MIGSAILLGGVSFVLLPLEMAAGLFAAITLWLTLYSAPFLCAYIGWLFGMFLGFVHAETHLWGVLSLIPVGIWFVINWRFTLAKEIPSFIKAFRNPLARRKMFRYCGLIFPCIIYPLWGPSALNKSLMVATAIAFISEKTVSYVPILERWFKAIAPASYERRKKSISGTTCYLLGAFVASLFPDPASVQAIVMATIGDAWAVLVGKRWGKLKWFEGKTLEVSLACLAGALLGSFIYGLMVPEAQIPWLILLWGGLVTLFTEGIFRFELDNLLVAPVSAAIMTAVIWIAYFF
jgi:dolichol kinase